MPTTSVTDESWARARAVATNPASPLAEIAAVHDLLWPAQAPICPTLTCTRKLGEAWRAIVAAVRRHDTAQLAANRSTPKSFSVMRKPQIRTRQFINPETVYTPHGTGAAYTNKNLTPEIVDSILKSDPDAERLFEPLEEEEADEQEEELTETAKPLAKQNKAELIATYTAELGTAPDEKELNTNALLVAAIEARRAAPQQ